MFQIMASREPVQLTDPKSIRALAHPARLAVIEELYSGRELTATECAEIAGMSPSAMSYHLRSLEKAGIVERADGNGDGRERPWRAAGSHLEVRSESALAENAALSTVLLSRLGEQLAVWEAHKGEESRSWRDASAISSGQVYLRVEELAQLTETIGTLLEKFAERSTDDHPEDSRRVRFSLFAFPAEQRPPTTRQ